MSLLVALPQVFGTQLKLGAGVTLFCQRQKIPKLILKRKELLKKER
jgi:hypothetical protein